MLTMKDIILEGNPTLRKQAAEVELPLSEEDKTIGKQLIEFVKNSQDPKIAKKYKLRSGVGLAAPQIDISKQIIAVVVPSIDEENSNKITFEDVMFNPKIISNSVQEAALYGGEGCLSVNREVPGYVVRSRRITVEYYDLEGNKQRKKFKDYEAIVVQHEIDHLKGIMFYDYINKDNPLVVDPKVKII